MGGLFADVLVEFLYRVIAGFLSRIRSRRWPAISGSIIRSKYRKAHYGCDLAVVRYKYFVADQRSTAAHKEPFLMSGTGYVQNLPSGTPITIRYKPDDPSRSVALI